jgi:hypothetical protein
MTCDRARAVRLETGHDRAPAVELLQHLAVAVGGNVGGDPGAAVSRRRQGLRIERRAAAHERPRLRRRGPRGRAGRRRIERSRQLRVPAREAAVRGLGAHQPPLPRRRPGGVEQRRVRLASADAGDHGRGPGRGARRRRPYAPDLARRHDHDAAVRERQQLHDRARDLVHDVLRRLRTGRVREPRGEDGQDQCGHPHISRLSWIRRSKMPA